MAWGSAPALDRLPTLGEQPAFHARCFVDETFNGRLQFHEDRIPSELKAERVAVCGRRHDADEVVDRAAEMPQHQAFSEWWLQRGIR